MKRCKNCNQVYDDSQMFCQKCGTPLSEEEPKSKGSKAAVILLGIGTVVLIVACILLMGMFKDRQKEMEIKKAQEAAIEAQEEAEEAAEEAARQAAQEEAERQAAQEEAERQAAEEAARQAAEEEAARRAQEEAERQAAEEEAARQAEEQAREQQFSALAAEWDQKLYEAEEEDHFIARSNRGGFDNEMYTEQARYNLWDALLNELWQDLKGVMSETAMNTLRAEQQEWIRQKEKMVEDFWSNYDVDYSGYPDAPASVMTMERVYYLRNYIPN